VSAADLESLLDQMERWLADPAWAPEAEDLTRWVSAFREARDSAAGRAAWPALAARGHALSQALMAPLRGAEESRDALRARLAAWSRGARALQAYAPRD